MAEMKPCPFCGEQAVLFTSRRVVDHKSVVGYFVSCDNFDCKELPMTDICKTEEEAIADWNRRAE